VISRFQNLRESEGQTGAKASSLDTSCTNRTAHKFNLYRYTAGVPAEFSAGALVCAGGTVCVRKAADGPGSENLLVEGALSDDFYRVRQILYGQYQIT
jgi:hypothetical protein